MIARAWSCSHSRNRARRASVMRQGGLEGGRVGVLACPELQTCDRKTWRSSAVASGGASTMVSAALSAVAVTRTTESAITTERRVALSLRRVAGMQRA